MIKSIVFCSSIILILYKNIQKLQFKSIQALINLLYFGFLSTILD